MKGIALLRRVKALFLFVFFIGIAFILLWQRGQGVASFLSQFTFALETWVSLFILGGLTNLWVAVKDVEWQLVGFVGWYTYTLATLFAIADGIVPVIAGWIYVGISVLFIIETWKEIKGVLSWIRNHLFSL